MKLEYICSECELKQIQKTKTINRRQLVRLFPYDTNREKIEYLLKIFGVKITL